MSIDTYFNEGEENAKFYIYSGDRGIFIYPFVCIKKKEKGQENCFWLQNLRFV